MSEPENPQHVDAIVDSEVKSLFMACAAAKHEEAVQSILGGAPAPIADRVRKLLAAAENMSPLDAPFDFLTLPSQGTEPPTRYSLADFDTVGRQIGNYKLLEQIGEGGMGSVFIAQQFEPVRRKVALKIIKPGMDSRQVVARFEAERQALALMDHPNIAKVFDGGTTDQGLPYFVMELVRGLPITEFVTTRSEGLESRLRLFVDLCTGVQHAHQRGIIHRDLKPSNVLVTLHDDTAVVKIIDFGIAKAINQELTDKTLFTQFAGMVGTPLYMSPEQAELSGLDVDTRSDVYSLGVLLYELLSGSPPFDRETLRGKGLDEIRRMIRETIPLRPSQRVSTIRNSNSTTVSGPSINTIHWHRSQLAGELDWIVMKAIEKKRERRYQSTRELGDDVRRHLDGKVVLARPPRLAYLASKWIHNHRLVAFSAVTIACVVAISFLLIFRQRQEAILQANRANEIAQEESKQRLALEESLERQRVLQSELQREKDNSEQRLYRNQIRLASFEWEYGNPSHGREILLDTDVSRRRWEYDYLDQLTLQGQHAHYADNQAMISAAFVSGEYDYALTVDTRSIHFWERDTGKPIKVIQSSGGRITRAALHPDGKNAAVLTFEKSGSTISIHECPTGKLLQATTIPSFRGVDMKYHPDGQLLAVCGFNQGILFFDCETLTQFPVEIPHTRVKQLIFPKAHPTRLLAADESGGIVEHQIPTKQSRVFEEDIEAVIQSRIEMVLDLEDETFSAAWSDEKSLLATSHNKSIVRIWRLDLEQEDDPVELPFGILEDVADARLLYTLKHPSRVIELAFIEGGSRIITGCGDGIIRIWDFESGNVVRELKGHDAAIRRLSVSNDERWVVSSTINGDTTVWDLKQEKQPFITDHTGTHHTWGIVPISTGQHITCLAACPDNRHILVGTQYGRCGVWDLEQKKWSRWRTIHNGPVWNIAFGTDPEQFVSCGITDKTIKHWTMKLTQPLAVFENTSALSADIDAKVKQLASGLDLFSLVEQRQVLTRPDNVRAAASTAYSPDGKFIATISVDSKLRIFDRASQKTTTEQAAPPGLRKTVAVSTDSRFVACCGDQSTVISVFDLANENALIELRGHITDVESIAFIDDTRLVSCSEAGWIRIWDATSPSSLLRISTGGVAATQVAVSPDHKSIFAACSDRRVRQWKIE